VGKETGRGASNELACAAPMLASAPMLRLTNDARGETIQLTLRVNCLPSPPYLE
jgi:hypothetical protein